MNDDVLAHSLKEKGKKKKEGKKERKRICKYLTRCTNANQKRITQLQQSREENLMKLEWILR